MHRLIVMLAVAGLALPSSSAAQLTPFSCPPAGTKAEFTTGGRFESLGSDPTDPLVCLVRAGNVERRLLYGFWRLPFSHRGAEPSVRAALGQLYPTAPGKTVTYELFLPRINGGDDPYRETWTIIGTESVTVRAGRFTATVMERTQEGRGGNTFKGTWRRWTDVASGLVVKQTFALERGSIPPAQEWEATSVFVPTPPAPPAAPARQQPAPRPQRS
jgi:hypothetical protein